MIDLLSVQCSRLTFLWMLLLLERTRTGILSKKLEGIMNVMTKNIEAFSSLLQVLNSVPQFDYSNKERKAVIDKRDTTMLNLHKLLGNFALVIWNCFSFKYWLMRWVITVLDKQRCFWLILCFLTFFFFSRCYTSQLPVLLLSFFLSWKIHLSCGCEKALKQTTSFQFQTSHLPACLRPLNLYVILW